MFDIDLTIALAIKIVFDGFREKEVENVKTIN